MSVKVILWSARPLRAAVALLLVATATAALIARSSTEEHPTASGSAPSHRPDWPTPVTTGWRHTGVTLSPYSGPLEITIDGTVIDGQDIRGCLSISANDVVIRRSRIACAGESSTAGGTMVVQQSTAYAPDVSGLTLTDVEITRPKGSVGGADYGLLLYGRNVSLTRVQIHNVTSGIHLSGGATTIENSWLGGFVNISGEDHNDGVIANGGVSDVVLRHNAIDVPLAQTTPIAMYPSPTPNTRWLIQDNLLSGGSYCIYPSYTKGAEQPNSHIVITRNVFSRHRFDQCGAAGPVNTGVDGGRFGDGVGNVWTNNVWADSGAPVWVD